MRKTAQANNMLIFLFRIRNSGIFCIVLALSVTIARIFDILLMFLEALAKTNSSRLTRNSAVWLQLLISIGDKTID